MVRFNFFLQVTFLAFVLLICKKYQGDWKQLQKSNHRFLTQLRGGFRSTKLKSGKREHITGRSTLARYSDKSHLFNTKRMISKLHDKKRENPLVFYSIFAGREATLELQLPHILKLLEQNIVDEVHLWDFSCKQKREIKNWFGNGKNDTEFLWEKMWPKDERIYIVEPARCSWRDYYEYYSNLLHGGDVLIKADDDILFVDTSRVQGFVDTIRNFPQVYLWSASVINNGVVAGIHDKDGLLPPDIASLDYEVQRPLSEGVFAFNATAGQLAHTHFLNHPQKYYRPPPGKELRLIKGRLSINFVAWLGRNFHRTSSYIRTSGKNVDAGGGDEWVVTQLASAYFGQNIVVYLPLVVAHASFGQQNMYEKIISLYKRPKMDYVLRNRVDWSPPEDGFEFPSIANI